MSPEARTPTFWRDLVAGDDDRVVGAVRGRGPDDFHPGECEMHPNGDEVLCLEEPAGDRPVALGAGQVFVVPRGVWHRLVLLRAPADLLFVTPPHGTQLRPARGR